MSVTPFPDLDVRRRAVVMAGHLGRPDVARAGLSDADPTVRAAALGALQRLGSLDAPTLRRGLLDHLLVARRAAELAAARPGDGDIDATLVALLGGADATLVEVAAWALGERHQEGGGGDAGPVVAALAAVADGHPDALCREAAVAALGATGHAAALAPILRATTDKTTVRRRAVIALAPYEGPEVDAALARALGDRDWQVRQAAEDLTGDNPSLVSGGGP